MLLLLFKRLGIDSKLKKIKLKTIRKESVEPCDLINIDKIICK